MPSKNAQALKSQHLAPSSTEAYWPVHRIPDGDELNDWVTSGKPYGSFFPFHGQQLTSRLTRCPGSSSWSVRTLPCVPR